MFQEEAKPGKGRSYTKKGRGEKFAKTGNSERGGDMLMTCAHPRAQPQALSGSPPLGGAMLINPILGLKSFLRGGEM